jgi:hypothetical protein
MLVAFALLLIHPQLAPLVSISAQNEALNAPEVVTVSMAAAGSESSMPSSAESASSSATPAGDTDAELPDAPQPVLEAVASPAPMAFLRSGKPLIVSVAQLRDEDRVKERVWMGLVAASSGAATFDAFSTRRAISNYGAVELNPLLKPFAGNSSLYAAIQVAPVLLDFAGKKLMYSPHSWIRRVWWVPQGASFLGSIFCGAHNLAYR